MKVIDLLNKIANGEMVKFIYKDNRFAVSYGLQIHNDTCGNWVDINIDRDIPISMNYAFLNDEVEIIEDEPRGIEVCGSLFTRSEYNKLAGIKEDKKIEKLKLYAPYPECSETRFDDIQDKINEIIDYLEENK